MLKNTKYNFKIYFSTDSKVQKKINWTKLLYYFLEQIKILKL